MDIDYRDYEAVVVYGTGQYYESIKEELFQQIRPDYLCDRKWEGHTPKTYDGIPVIKKAEMIRLNHILVIVAVQSGWQRDEIVKELSCHDIKVIYANDLVALSYSITGKMLKEKFPKGYQDRRGNKIFFDETISDHISVFFHGKNNVLHVGNKVPVSHLQIFFGTEGVCMIGDRTEIIDAVFTVSGARLLIGSDCLFSMGIMIRTHDGHHIFDLDTHKRMNYPKDVVIENGVWVGNRATLLAGAKIGNGSVIGEGAITSRSFGNHQIIAGSPARMIREHIYWNREDTNYFNRDYLEECISQKPEETV